ncbi:zinc-binding dehydrogenase [Brevibacterium album]|uniref:zinc-binding dehydrogenase n=1 Tax=Brevibacterium album TaxID=417948 RepID=UPI00040163E5|nr:zinc-binding dehydrogenase [Brevibacterium album]
MTATPDIPTTSRAAVVTEFGKPLEIREVPIPEPPAGALIVKIEAAGICGTDVHVADGSAAASQPIELPIIPGHEMVGRIVRFGEDAERDSAGQELALGDRIVFTHSACGRCFHCTVTKQPGLCRERIMYAFTSCAREPYLTGGFAEYCYVFPTSGRIRVPDEVDTEWATAASCALRSVVTSFQRLGTIEPWENVVIQGSGPLGLFATAMASVAGANQIIVIGDPESRLALARRWGATSTISVGEHPTAEERAQIVQDLTGGAGADIVMEFSGARTAFAEGLDLIRDGGRYVVTGQMGPQEVTITPVTITRRHLTILGSWSGEAAQYWRALEFMRIHRERFDFGAMITGRYHLDQANEAMERMQRFEEIKPIILPTLSTDVHDQADVSLE